MMDWTDRHCRYFLRLLSPDARLYTEMINARAILRGDAARLLGFDAMERPLALQLGGNVPAELGAASRIARDFGFDEVNLNVGCPSDRVRSGQFGACLMASPALVADCVRAMTDAWGSPATVKTRIGIDDRDDYGFLADFVEAVRAAGCRTFIVHARKAILQGLSPKENRTIPPLRYDRVLRLKRDFPELEVVVNGGIGTVDAVAEHLAVLDGVMIGRKAYHDPWFLSRLQARFLDGPEAERQLVVSRGDIVRGMAEYAEAQLSTGVRLHQITRHMLGLYTGLPGARRWRRFLAEEAPRSGAGPQVLLRSLAILDEAA
jgi:tRNA-dihydrouridine synthase A